MWSSRREWDRRSLAASTYSVEIGAPEAESRHTDASPCAYPATLVAAPLLMTTGGRGRRSSAAQTRRNLFSVSLRRCGSSCGCAAVVSPIPSILTTASWPARRISASWATGAATVASGPPTMRDQRAKKRASLPANRRRTSTYVNRLAPATPVDRVGDGTARDSPAAVDQGVGDPRRKCTERPAECPLLAQQRHSGSLSE